MFMIYLKSNPVPHTFTDKKTKRKWSMQITGNILLSTHEKSYDLGCGREVRL